MRLPLLASQVVALTMLGSLTQGATLSVPLSFSVASGSDGDYLVADFDFDTRFTSIEQVMLEFVLPSGFESVSSTTGNSSYTSTITYALLEEPVALEGVLTHKTSGNAIPGPTHVLLNIPAGEEGSYPLFSHLSIPGNPTPPPPIPQFLFQGKGAVGVAQLSSSWYHPLPEGDMVSSTTQLSADLNLVDARLVIVGTAVPEPASISLSALLALLSIAAYYPAQRARRRAVRQGTTAQASR